MTRRRERGLYISNPGSVAFTSRQARSPGGVLHGTLQFPLSAEHLSHCFLIRVPPHGRKPQRSMRLTQFSKRSLKDHRYKFKRVFVHILSAKDALLSHLLTQHGALQGALSPSTPPAARAPVLFLSLLGAALVLQVTAWSSTAASA